MCLLSSSIFIKPQEASLWSPLFLVLFLLYVISSSHGFVIVGITKTTLTRNPFRQQGTIVHHPGHGNSNSNSSSERFSFIKTQRLASTIKSSFSPNGNESDNDDKEDVSTSTSASTNKEQQEEKLPKYSQSIPFLARPKHLKLELAGDVGFDPLNFCQNRDLLMEYREAEIKHSRLAMLAAVGWPMSELYDVKIANILQKEPMVDASDRVPSLFNGGMEKIHPVWWGFCLGLTAAIDLYGVNRARTMEGYTPGDLGWDPLNLYPTQENKEGRSKMQLAEIKHGRLAMVAVTAYSVQEYVTGVGIVDETPLFFKPVEVLEEVLEKVVESS